jgi:hypothetical protein
VILVFEDFDFSRVGQMQSLLESHGIKTFIRNQFGSSVMGEVPFVEVVPQLFVLEQKDVQRAMALLQSALAGSDADGSWTCRDCGADVESNFSHCWQCGSVRASP